MTPARKSKPSVVQLEQAGLEVGAKAAAKLDVLKAIYSVVEEASKRDDADSEATRFHGDSHFRSVRT